MGGKVWAESAFGEGSTFYVSLPRLTPEEYERQKMVIRNTEMMPTSAPKAPAGMAAATMAAAVPLAAPTAPVATPVAPVTTSAALATTPVTTATETQPQPAPAPAQQPVQSQPETQPTADVSNMSPEQLAAAKQQFAAQTSQNSTSVIQ